MHLHLNADLFKLWWPTEPEDPEYVGCYHDDKADRVLAHKITIPGMTSAVCRDHCLDKDALFYATQVHIYIYTQVCVRAWKDALCVCTW